MFFSQQSLATWCIWILHIKGPVNLVTIDTTKGLILMNSFVSFKGSTNGVSIILLATMIAQAKKNTEITYQTV